MDKYTSPRCQGRAQQFVVFEEYAELALAVAQARDAAIFVQLAHRSRFARYEPFLPLELRVPPSLPVLEDHCARGAGNQRILQCRNHASRFRHMKLAPLKITV